MLSTDDVFRAVPYPTAIDAVEDALRYSVDPAADPARSAVAAGADGHVLLMPSVGEAYVGVKIASVVPDNPTRGLPRIQAVYVLMSAATLTPVALIDGTALTTIRTPAVSAVAARRLAPEHIDRLVVFGSGPQARGHIEALAAVREIRGATIVGRNRERAVALAQYATECGVPADVGDADAVRDADLIVCATTSPTPLFDGSLVADHACVLAIGSHEPDCRELDSTLMARSTVVVEDPATALREAGDVVLAIADGVLDDQQDLVPLRDVVRGSVAIPTDRPAVFKGTGMSWQDLAVAAAAFDAS